MNPYILAADIINWLSHQARYRDFPTWTNWRKFIQNEVLLQGPDLWRQRILITRSVINAKKLTPSELISKMEGQDEFGKENLNQAIELYFHILEDGLLEDKMRSVWKTLSAGILEDGQLQNPDLLIKKYEDQLLRPVIRVPRSWFPLLIFIALDIATWRFLVAKDNIGSILFATGFHNYKDWYQAAMPFYQLVFLPLVSFLLFSWRNAYVKAKTAQKLKPYYGQSPKVISEVVPWQNVISFAFYILDITIFGHDYFIPSLIVKGLIFHWICQYASLAIPNVSQILKINQTSKFLSTSELDADENNIEILTLDVALNNYKTRLESYLLESALLGALAFGGVLQVVALTGFNFNYSRQFFSNIQTEIKAIVLNLQPNMPFFEKSVSSLDGIGAWTCILSLMCSVFFLAVIASRIWFSKYYVLAYQNIEMAKHLNTVEDNNKANSLPFTHLTEQIRIRLKNTTLACQKLADVVEYMDITRSLGVFSFFLVVFMTGRFMGNQFYLLLILVYLINALFIRQDKLIFVYQNVRMALEEFYFNWSKTIEMGLGIFLVISTLILSFINIELGNDFYSWFFVATSIWMFFSLLYPDLELEKETQNREGYQHTSWSHLIQTKSMRFAIALFAVYFVFKNLNWPGAAPILVLGTLITIIGAAFTKLLKSHNIWLRILTGITIALAAASTTLYILRWSIGTQISNAALVFLGILLVLVRFRLTVFTGFTRKWLLLNVIIIIALRFVQTGIPADINPPYLFLKHEWRKIPSITARENEILDKPNNLSPEQKDKIRLVIYHRMDSALQLLLPVKDHAVNQKLPNETLHTVFILAHEKGLPPTRQIIIHLKQWPFDSTDKAYLNKLLLEAKD